MRIEVSVNFALEFQLKCQVAETLLRFQDFFYRPVALGVLGELQPLFLCPHTNLKRPIIYHGDIILN